MQKSAIKKKSILFIILGLFTIGFGTINSYIYVLLVIAALLLTNNRELLINCEFFILTICFLILYFSYNIYYEQNIVLYTVITICIGPISGYCVGQFLVKDEKSVKPIICISCMGFLLHGILNLWFAPTATIWYDQNIADFWTGDKVSATLNGAFFTGAIVLFCFFYHKDRIRDKVIAIILICIMLWSSLKTAERTLMLNLILSVIIYIYGRAFFEKKGRETISKMIKYTYIICGIVLIGAILYLNDFMGIQTAFLNTSLGSRLTMLDSFMQDGRDEGAKAVINALWKHPMGGFRDTLFYAHNLFIDTGRMCGVVPMLLLFIYICLILVRLFKICKNSEIQLETRMLVFVFYFAYLVNFMLEPVLEGMPMIFVMFCIVNGAVAKLDNIVASYEEIK